MRQPGHLSRLPHSTRHTALYDITSGTCRALTYYVYKYRLHSADETFNGDDHKQKAHKAHHYVVARLAEHAHKARGGAQDEVCKHVDKHYRAYQYALHRYCMGVAHQHDGVGYGARTAEHRYAQRRYRYVVGIGLYLVRVELHVRVACLQHVVAYLEDYHAAGYAEAVGGYAEEHEDKLAGKGEHDEDDERRDGGALYDRLALLLAHALGHGKKHGHRAERIGKRED